MIYLGKVVKTSSESNGKFQSRIHIRISPLHDGLNDSELPKLKSFIQNDTQYSNFKNNEYVYVYTEDDLLQDLYYLGRKNSSIDLNKMLENMDYVNQNLENKVRATFTSYNLDSFNIHCINAGMQLIFINGEDNFTLISEKTNGNIFYIDSDKIDIYKSKVIPIDETDVDPSVADDIKTERHISLTDLGVSINMAHVIDNPDFDFESDESTENPKKLFYIQKKIVMEKTKDIEDIKIYLNDKTGAEGESYHERQIQITSGENSSLIIKSNNNEENTEKNIKEIHLNDDEILINVKTDAEDSPENNHSIVLKEEDGVLINYKNNDEESKIELTSDGIYMTASSGKKFKIINDSQSLKDILKFMLEKLQSAYSGQGLMGNLGAPIIALNPSEIANFQTQLNNLDSLME